MPTKNCQTDILNLNTTQSITDSFQSNQGKQVEISEKPERRKKSVTNKGVPKKHDPDYRKITRKNLHEYLLKDLIEQEKAFDEAEALDEEAPFEEDPAFDEATALDEEKDLNEKIALYKETPHDEKTALDRETAHNEETANDKKKEFDIEIFHGNLTDHDYFINSLGHYTGTTNVEVKAEPMDDQYSIDCTENALKIVKIENMDQDMDQDEGIINPDKMDYVRTKTDLIYPDHNMTKTKVKEDIIKNELTEIFGISNDISSVFQASASVTGAVRGAIKEEPLDEFDFEDDIIVLNNENFSFEDNPIFKATGVELATELNSCEIDDMSKFEPEIIVSNESPCNDKSNFAKILRNKKEYVSDIKVVSNRSSPQAQADNELLNETPGKRKGKKLYTCKKCNFEDVYREFKKHLGECRATRKFTKITNEDENELANKSIWGQFYCTKCNCIFFTLKKYLLHFICHKVKLGSCPVCAIEYSDITRLCLHFIAHVKNSFTINEQAMKETENFTKQSEELCTQYDRLIKKNEDAIKFNNRIIKKNEKHVLQNEKNMNDELLMKDDVVNVMTLEKNKKLFNINAKLVLTNEGLKAENKELKLKLSESSSRLKDVSNSVVYECKDCKDIVLQRDTFCHFEKHLTWDTPQIKIDTDEMVNQNAEISAAVDLSPELKNKIFGK